MYKEWTLNLRGALKKLPNDEVDKILDYYNEMYLDKTEGGESPKSILNEFGNPYDIAYKLYYEYHNCQDVNVGSESKKVTEPKCEPMQEIDNVVTQGEINSTIPQVGKEVEQVEKVELQAVKEEQAKDTASKIDYVAYIKTSYDEYHKAELKRKSSRRSIAVKLAFIVPYITLVIVVWSVIIAMWVSAAASVLAGVAGLFGMLILGTSSSGGALLVFCGGLVALAGIGVLLGVVAYYMTKFAKVHTVRYFYKSKHVK